MEKTLESLNIPVVNDATVKYYVNGEYQGDITNEQCCKIRESVVEYIMKTNDASILNDFYFIGHKDTNDGRPGEEIKIVMVDTRGNLSDLPWELSHVRRSMFKLMKWDIEKSKTK